jgi:predicted nucleic acid-binding protein
VIVVDASVAVDVLLRTPGAESAAERILADDASLHAPELIDIEVAQVLRRLVLQGGLYPPRAAEALELFAAFPLTRHSHASLMRRVWELRENITAYDAAYVALAEGLDATLVTRDKRLARVAKSRARIEVL